MKKSYIICVDKLTNDQSEIIIDYLNKNNLGWWHWINDIICVSDNKGVLDAVKIRDAVMKIASDQRVIVFELNDDNHTWAGSRANDPDLKMFEWFKKNWK